MGLKPFDVLNKKRAKPKTRVQKKAKTAMGIRDAKLKNLEKARRVRKKNLAAKKRANKK